MSFTGGKLELLKELMSEQKPPSSERAQKFEQEKHLLLKQFISLSLQCYLISYVFDTSYSSAEGAKSVRAEKKETICSNLEPVSVTYCMENN